MGKTKIIETIQSMEEAPMIEKVIGMGTIATIAVIFLAITIPLAIQYIILKIAIKNALIEAAQETTKEDRTYYITKSAIRDGIVEAQEEIRKREKKRETETGTDS